MLKRNVADNILSSGHDDDESRLSEAREEGGGDDRLSFRVSDRGLDFGRIE